MAQPAPIFEQPHDRTAKLYVLGLHEATIEAAVIRGLTQRRACTPFHPPSYPGTTQWAETHAALRELLTLKDWTPNDDHNYSRVVSPDQRIAVTVATGDEHTGEVGALQPRTKYSKGSETKLAVEANAQLSLLPTTPPEGAPQSQRVTWILLIATDKHEMRYELSRPQGQDEDGRVVSWSERIVFPPIEIDSLPARNDDHDDDDDEGSTGIDVPVERI